MNRRRSSREEPWSRSDRVGEVVVEGVFSPRSVERRPGKAADTPQAAAGAPSSGAARASRWRKAAASVGG